MLSTIKNREDSEKLEELASLKNQVEEFQLQYNLGKENYHEDTKNLLEPLPATFKSTSENITKTITQTSNKNNKALKNINEKVLGLKNDKGMIALTLASSLVIPFTPENKSQFRLIKDLTSTKMDDFFINTSKPVTLYSSMLTFGDTNKSSILDGDLLKTMTNFKFNVDHSNLEDRTKKL